MLSIRYVRGLVERAVGRGAPRTELLKASHLLPEQLESAEDRICTAQFFQLCELALDMSGDAALGLHSCGQGSAHHFDLYAYLVVHAPTMRDGLEAQISLHKLIADERLFARSEDAQHVTLRYVGFAGARGRVQKLLSEMHVLGAYECFRYFAPSAPAPRISFAYAPPVHAAEYHRVFQGADVQFSAGLTGIVFDRALMANPSPNRNPELFQSLRSQVETRIARLEQNSTYADRIRDLIITQPSLARANMNTVARALGTSARSLRRQLVAEGVYYSAIVSSARGSVAKQLLSVERRSVQETAQAMGYADASAFHRAFKRWTGTTPSACRQGSSAD